MKITKKQREAIIKKAIKQQPYFLCNSLRNAIEDILHVEISFLDRYKEIRKYIPKFKYRTAVKYFNANGTIDAPWWNTKGSVSDSRTQDSKNRLAFLNYLLTGKLPKKVSEKK